MDFPGHCGPAGPGEAARSDVNSPGRCRAQDGVQDPSGRCGVWVGVDPLSLCGARGNVDPPGRCGVRVGVDFPGHAGRLLGRLREQRERGILCDCSVLVGPARFPAHRAVLAACSAFFQLCFRDRPAGDVVRLSSDVVTAPAFGRLLDFIYRGRLDLSGLPLEDVLAAARYLRLDAVVQVCQGLPRAGETSPHLPLHPLAPQNPQMSAHLPPTSPHLLPHPQTAQHSLPLALVGQASPPDGALDLSLKPGQRTDPGRPRGQDRPPRSETPARPRSPPLAPQGGPPGLCPLCGRLFPGAPSLQPHLRAHLRARVRPTPGPDSAAPTCALCGKRFSCAYTLRRHARTHSGEKPHTCAQCGRAFQYAHNLSRHAVVHTRAKPHACRWCPRRFTQSGDLYRHERKFHCGLA